MKKIISIILSIVLMVSSFVFIPHRVSAAIDKNRIIGEWKGSYSVEEADGKQHERIITLKILSYDSGAIKGTFEYYSPDYRGGLLGIYYFEGSINESSKTFSLQGKYMVLDDGYYSHDSYSTYTGTIDWDNGIMKGNHGGDYELHHSALSSNNKFKPSDVVHAYVGKHYGTSVGGGYSVQRASTIDITSCSENGIIEGRFIIYPIAGASNQINCIYKFSGFIDLETGNIGFMGTQWIQYPEVGDSWTFQNYVGKLQGDTISGNNGNGTFKHKIGYVDKKGDVYIPVTGLYKDGSTEKVLSDREVYKDAYFNGNSVVGQGDLAKLSMLAAATAYNKSYAESLMKQCGFEYKYFSSKVTKSNNDKVSYIVGTKKVNGTNIVAVWVKGTSANYEWVSNFNLDDKGKKGKKKVHEGFSKAEAGMNSSISSYLKAKGINNNIRFWVTGHSRGAAVANLYAKRLTDKYSKYSVFAYTFATPRVSKSGKKSGYENIRNYLNPGDFVTEVAPKKWGYKRYGSDITFNESNRSAMANKYKALTKKNYGGFNSGGKNSLVNAFVKYGGKSVKTYYKKKTYHYKKKKKKKTLKASPADYCKKGLALYLNSSKKVKKKGENYIKIVSTQNGKAAKVSAKMIIDGGITNQFKDAHTQAGYICWLKVMYG